MNNTTSHESMANADGQVHIGILGGGVVRRNSLSKDPPTMPVIEVPRDIDPTLHKFMCNVAEVIQIREGDRGSGLERFVTLRDLVQAEPVYTQSVIDQVDSPFTDSTAPPPPTNLHVVQGVWNNRLTWINPDSDIVMGIEVWVSNSNNRSFANRVAVVTIPQDSYTHFPADVTNDHYYWIRSISYATQYSEWEPNDSQGGLLVRGSDTVGETIDKVLAVLHGKISENQLVNTLKTRLNMIETLETKITDLAANLYNADTTYYFGDLVRYTDDKMYKCIDDDSGAGITGIIPTNTTHWVEAESVYSELAGLLTRANQTENDILTHAGQILSHTSSIDALIADLDDPMVGIKANLAIAQQNIQSHAGDITDGKNGTWASISNKVQATTYNADINAAGGLKERTSLAEQSLSVHAGELGQMKSEYFVKLDSNGFFAGFGMLATEGVSEAVFYVNTFRIVTPGQEGILRQPFVVGQVDDVSTVGIDGNLVVDQSIHARSIRTDELMVGGSTGAGFIRMADGVIEVRHINSASSDEILNSHQKWNEIEDMPSQIHQTFYQAAAPTTGINHGDLWLRSTDNQWHRHTGIAWSPVQDSQIGAAVLAANSAQNTADTKIRTFFQHTAPTSGMSLGDIWFKTNDNNKPFRYNGSSWLEAAYDVADWQKIFGAGKPESGATNDSSWRHNNNTTLIDGGKIFTGTVIANAIGANQITATHVGANTIITSHANITNAVITTAKIADANITTAKIANANITTAKIGDAQITNAKIVNAAVDTLKIGTNAVTVPASAYTEAQLNNDNTNNPNGVRQSVSLDSAGQPIQVFATANTGTNQWVEEVTVRIRRNTTLLTTQIRPLHPWYYNTGGESPQWLLGGYKGNVAIMVLDTNPPAGVNTYHLEMPNTAASHRSMFAIGVKR